MKTKLSYSEVFVVRANETDMGGCVTVPALCNYLQELAGVHACNLGVGIDQMQAEGTTWMMSGLHLTFTRFPQWREALTITTWPSSCRGRLLTTRDFLVHDASENLILAGISEWLMIDRRSHKITRLPAELQQWIASDGPRAPVPEAEKLVELQEPRWSAAIVVKRSHIDLNNHANNVHYVSWLLEPLPEAYAGRAMRRLDISYRAAALQGDALVSEVEPCDQNQLLHRIRRVGDGSLITLARTTWS